MPVIKDNLTVRSVEMMIRDYANKESGHFIVASDDRLFANVFRKTMVQQVGLSHDSLSIVNTEGQIMKTVKEMSVRKRKLLVFVEALFEHKRMDDLITQINRRVRNATVVILTTESSLPRLALLRERGIADNWITKPIIVNALLIKIAHIIKPPGELERLVTMAEESLKVGSYKLALKTCSRIFQIKPDSAVAYLIMGDVYKAMDKEEKMVEAYEQAGDVEELYFDPLNRLVDHFKEKKDYDRALLYMERLDTQSPLNMERKVNIGGLYLDLGDTREAREIFEDAIATTAKEDLGDPAEITIKVGDEYKERNMEEAAEFYRRGLDAKGAKLTKADLATFNNLGLSLRKQGQWRQALDEYKKALKVDPKSDILYYNLAMAYTEGKQIKNALKCAEYALKLNPDLTSEDPVICYNLAMIFARAKDADRAKLLLGKALELNPAYESAKELLASLGG